MKLKLIEVLNKQANGEIKEGSKLKICGDEYNFNGTRWLMFSEEDNIDFRLDYKVVITEGLNEKCELIEPSILTDKEKEYLKQVLKFGNYGDSIQNGIVESIEKYGYFIHLNLGEHHCNTIYIDKKIYFKGMEEEKKYSLEELRIIKE